jgi:hypothetical protein
MARRKQEDRFRWFAAPLAAINSWSAWPFFNDA